MLYDRVLEVTRVEEKFTRNYLGGHGESAAFEDVSLGWYVQTRGSLESVRLGSLRPLVMVGDRIRVTMEVVP